MERTSTAVLNGHQAPVGEEDLKSYATVTSSATERLAPVQEPEVLPQIEEKIPQPKPPQKKGPVKAILATLGVGAIAAAGTFGYNYWQFASSHQSTENATVAGHIHNVSSRINGTVADVLVNDNQLVQKGQLLVKLDPRDYQVKAQQAEAALEAAKRQANAAGASIALASQTATAKTTTAQGDIGNAVAGIDTAKAAVAEAESGVPAAGAALQQAEAGVPQAQAAVAAAAAGVPQAQAAVQEAQAGIAAAQAQLAQTQANLEKAQTDYNRYKSLYASGAIARQQLDSAKAAYEVAAAQKSAAQQGIQQAQARLAQAQEGVSKAQAQVAQARQGVASAQAQVAAAREGIVKAQARVAQAREGVASAQAKLASSRGGLQQATAGNQQTEVNRRQYEAAQAAIAQSEASLKDAQLQLSYTEIAAPADGQIGRKSVEVGQRVQPGTPLMAIVSKDLWIVANFKETQLEEMKPGQEVEIKLDAFPHHTFKGRVDSISPASGAQFALLPPDNATGNFTKVVQRIPVKIIFDRESVQGYESRITPGMSAEVTVAVK